MTFKGPGAVTTFRAVRTTRRHAVSGAIGAAVLLLAATACGSESNDSTTESLPGAVVEATTGPTEAPITSAPTTAGTGDTSPPAVDADPAPAQPAVFVPEALQFTAPLVGGGTFDGAAAAGKPTVFWFWAPT